MAGLFIGELSSASANRRSSKGATGAVVRVVMDISIKALDCVDEKIRIITQVF